MMKPMARPHVPMFSSGPTAKRPGWSLSALQDAVLGRSHRSKPGKAKLKEVIDASKAILGVPGDYRCAIVAGSDTGAVELALWSLLGQRGVDVLAFEAFGKDWVTDITKQLKLKDVRVFDAPYGHLPDLFELDCDRDVVFCWNGTTSGVRIPDDDWIPYERDGLTICDATSAAFAMPLPWDKLDVVTWSWQKALGGEAAHGMIVLSPRAVERLETFKPDRPLPKLFRLTKDGKISEGIFEGETINTPSMLAVEDCLDALRWANDIGGQYELIGRSQANLAMVQSWIDDCGWAEFLAEEANTVSSTSICLKITDPWFQGLSEVGQQGVIKTMTGMLEKEGVAYDIASYRDAPAGIRIWGGSTVEASDIELMLPWLDWAFFQVKHAAQAG